MDAHRLGALIRPRSIAIAGASSDPGKLGALPLQFLRKFAYDGELYPINARVDAIEGLRCFRSLTDIGRPVDLLIVAIAAERVPSLLDGCALGQVGFALVLSSNYAEAGEDGACMQRELVALANAKGIRLVGPNSVGIVNLWDHVVASISQVFDSTTLAPGPVAFVSQSGAVGTAITALAREQGLGVGYFVSTGNEADLEFSDFCDYFIDDPRVTVIAGYIESVRDGAKFRRAAKRAREAGKPIVLVKVGKSDVGGRAVRSHTGALAGTDAVYEAVFAADGVVRADGIEGLIDYLKMFVAYPRVAADRGRSRVAVLTHSGGTGVLMADAAIAAGLEMPPPSPLLRRALEEGLPPYASIDNPLDMTANVIFKPEAMAASVLKVARSGEYDAAMLCVNLIWRQGEALADAMLDARQQSDQRLALAWIAGPAAPVMRLAQGGVPVFGDPIRCVRAVAARLAWEQAGRIGADEPPPASVAHGDEFDLAGYLERQALLERHGIGVVPARLVHDAAEARQAARALGYPVAAKLIAPALLHKSDVGGVVLDIADDESLARAVGRLLAIPCEDREGILLQPMFDDPDAIELFAGLTQDPVFGPIVVFGLGGTFVEVVREVVMRPAPFGVDAALRMIGAARFLPLLQGFRGRKPCDLRAIAELLARLSTVAAAVPALRALDLNPVVASPRGAVVVDFKFELEN
jgi:acetyltransferase